MSESHVYSTEWIDLQLDNPPKLRRSRNKQMKDFFIAEINDR